MLNNKHNRAVVPNPCTKKKMCLNEVYHSLDIQPGGKSLSKGGKRCPTPPTEPRLVTIVIVPDSERVVTLLPRDINYRRLFQVVNHNDFPNGTEARLHMHWRIRTPYKFLTAVYMKFTEIFNKKRDEYIRPSFMGYLPTSSIVSRFNECQTIDTPENSPHIQIANKL
jgi:hypothetical protein